LGAADQTEACEKVDYIMQENDTLSTISSAYGVPMAAIQDYNSVLGIESRLKTLHPLMCDYAPVPHQPRLAYHIQRRTCCFRQMALRLILVKKPSLYNGRLLVHFVKMKLTA
jgi:hypothetical protein